MAIRMTRRITRRDFAAVAGGFLLSTKAVAQTETPLLTRPIPGSGERIPAVGLGTAYVFDENSEATRSKADAVVQALVNNGGRLIDTASTYGDAESVLGEVTATAGLREKIFIATKLESPDSQELKRSLTRLKTASVDLLQLHNVRAGSNSSTLQGLEEAGVCRYVGITSTFHRDYPVVEAVLEREKPDFVQIDYSLDNRRAEKTILPLAAEIRAGVLTALPYGNGRLFRAVHGKELPDWARVFANSWDIFPEIFARRPACDRSDPGDRRSRHMADNAGAMRGPIPIPINVVEWSSSLKRFDR